MAHLLGTTLMLSLQILVDFPAFVTVNTLRSYLEYKSFH